MKKNFLLFFLVTINLNFAQSRFSVTLEPVRFGVIEIGQYSINIQAAYRDSLSENFTNELRCGVVIIEPAIHLDILWNYQINTFFLKGGLLFALRFIGGGMEPAAQETLILPIIEIETSLDDNIFLEANYSIIYLGFGIGYKF